MGVTVTKSYRVMGANHKKAKLSRRQQRFIEEYEAVNGNASEAARRAGYSQSNQNVLGTIAWENMQKPAIRSALAKAEAQIAKGITPNRVKRRLHEISHSAEQAGQFGPSVRAEELLGKSIGMWVEQSIQLSGNLKDEHIQALLEAARRRRTEAVDNSDEGDDQRRSDE